MSKVKFNNVHEEVEAADGEALMEVTKTQGWPIAYGCEDGMCGTCIIRTAMGSLSPMDEKEKDTLEAMGMDTSQYRLACQCKVQGDVTIEQ